MTIRKLTKAQKEDIASKQSFKCANTIEDYECPLWAKQTPNAGSFGEEKYHIDHIKELWEGGNDDENNLQALCLSCHAVKTKRNAKERRKLNKLKETTSSKKLKKYDLQKLINEQKYYLQIKATNGVSYSQNYPDRQFHYEIENIPTQLDTKSYDFFHKTSMDVGMNEPYTYYTNSIDVKLNENRYKIFVDKFKNVLKDDFDIKPEKIGSGRFSFEMYSFILQDAIDTNKIENVNHITFLTSSKI
jgi:hypothetical protein